MRWCWPSAHVPPAEGERDARGVSQVRDAAAGGVGCVDGAGAEALVLLVEAGDGLADLDGPVDRYLADRTDLVLVGHDVQAVEVVGLGVELAGPALERGDAHALLV